MHYSNCLLPLALASAASAHMYMSSPPDIRGKENPNVGSNVDSDITANLAKDGFASPCKGNLKLLGTPQGAPVASWAAASTQTLTISGGSPHGGGSCQAALSLDRGASWRVIHTWIGDCPGLEQSSNFTFRVPGDVPASSEAVFSWTWFNKVGSREMYQGCSVVETHGGSAGSETVSFADRPALFVANVGGGCTTEVGTVKIPAPGPDVDVAEDDAIHPIGDCGPSGPSWAQSPPDSNPPSQAGPSFGPQASQLPDGGQQLKPPGFGDDNTPNSGYTAGNDWPANYGAAVKGWA